jgi:Ser/Thr protein kinase RdoA (MazF antagonist)
MLTGLFDLLTPQAAVSAVESAYDLVLDGTVQPYPSYINRVYGLRSDSGTEFVVKFYRPGRWTEDAILDEHQFLLDCAEAEIPVVPPILNTDNDTLSTVEIVDGAENEDTFHFALYPKMGGRNFDAENDEDWDRLGGIVGRCHAVAKLRPAPHRVTCSPDGLTVSFLDELLEAGVVHPEVRDEFETICRSTVETITPLFQGVPIHRVHGDCHRGNILDRPGTGLLIIDFDDMMMAPAVQDLWLLLPDHVQHCGREVALLQDGYSRFAELDFRQFRLVEPLRFMRIVYFLAWRARQRHDFWFQSAFPEWGSEAFWIKEIEDIRAQSRMIEESLSD